MMWIILISFMIVLTILILKLSYRLLRKSKLLLKDIWHVVDLFIILMSLACLGLYVSRSEVVRTFLLLIENAKKNEFVNYFHLMHTEKTLTFVSAVLVFLATLRLWKLMRFMLVVKILEKTLMLSGPPLLGLFLYQIIFILACTFYAVVKYGDRDYDFRGILITISNMFIISLNFYYNFNFEIISGAAGYIFYSMFMLVTLGIYTLYIAVITVCYAEAQFYYSNVEEYNIVNLIKEQCEYYGELVKVKWKNSRLRGGHDKQWSDRKVHPKADEFRYAKCVTLPTNKIEGMTLVTKCVLRNMKVGNNQITDKDADLIKHTIVSLFRKDTEEKEIFFKSNIQGEKMRFVDDNVMLKVERHVEAFLNMDNDRLENERRRKLYRKIVESHEQKMRDMDNNLNILLNGLSVVNVDV